MSTNEWIEDAQASKQTIYLPWKRLSEEENNASSLEQYEMRILFLSVS
jgi:hypothetical protein